MFKTTLVSARIKDGEKLLRKLTAQKFPVTAALWYYDPDRMDWKLILASDFVPTRGPLDAYMRIQRAMGGLKGTRIRLDDILVMSPQSRDFQELRTTIEGVGRIALPPQRVGPEGVHFEDAYVYRWPR